VLAPARDKPAEEMLAALDGWPARPALVVTRTRNARARDPVALHAEAAHRGWRALDAPDVPAAIDRALARAGRGRVLLAGSLFAVGEAMAAFGGAPEAAA
jgi:folylpolyglutamate synthase/dihydropteroate synthase